MFFVLRTVTESNGIGQSMSFSLASGDLLHVQKCEKGNHVLCHQLFAYILHTEPLNIYFIKPICSLIMYDLLITLIVHHCN